MSGKTKHQEELELRRTIMTNCIGDILLKLKGNGLSVRESLIVLNTTTKIISDEVKNDANAKPLSDYSLNAWEIRSNSEKTE